ncbi:DUF2141 domain-containing protein [Sphingomonas sp.]|jgi:uncharacterized protein (DUF2141 family)|uniref:DUF2141 domain-containing protein n=1 Tax=Sphingomonas sp. TaxID=28214 RepID=UPI002617E730|nr:DUF2141 domain-containing protein [Sphingomonas sp.]MDF2605115.1 hypothetical protein [Sphingomonas sp.]
MARMILAAAALAAASMPLAAQARVLGNDAASCVQRDGSAIEVTIQGLKDRTGSLKLELYPATEEDFLKDDRDLIKEGKFFRRVRVPTPAADPITLCIKAPAPGRYALFVTHDRDGKNKFNVWTDGAGVPSNERLGRSKPKLSQAIVTVPRGVARVTVRAQYLRGVIPSFGPVGR